MKKLLIIALLVASVAGIEAGRCRRNNNNCRQECKRECPTKCLPAPCITKCDSSYCEGDKPDICALKPARVNIHKQVDTVVSYSCAELGHCEVKPTQDQIDQLKDMGAIEQNTEACP